MFDQQQIDPDFIDDVLEEQESAAKRKAAAKNTPSVFGKFDVEPLEVKAPENLLGMKAAPTTADNILRFLTSTASGAVGGGLASRSPLGAVVGGGVQAADNVRKLMMGNELASPLSRENAGNLFGGLASGGAGAIANKAPALSAGMKGLLQGAAGGAAQGGIMDAEDPLGGAATGAALGGLMDGFGGMQRTRTGRTPSVVAEDVVRKMQGMQKVEPDRRMLSDLSSTAAKFTPTLKSFDDFYGPDSTARRGVTESSYNLANKSRQTAQLDFNNTLRSLDSKLQGALNLEQKEALKEFKAAEAALAKASPHRDALMKEAEGRVAATRQALQAAHMERAQKGLPAAHTRQAEEDYQKAVEAANKMEEVVTPPEFDAYEKALDRLNAKLPAKAELLRTLDPLEKEKLTLARRNLNKTRTEFEGLRKSRTESKAMESELRKYSNDLVATANSYGAVDLDPQKLINNPDQREFVTRLASSKKILDVFRSGEGFGRVAKGLGETFPPGSPARKQFASKAIAELMDEVIEPATSTKFNVYGTINSDKLKKALDGIDREGMDTLLESKTGYDDVTGLIHKLADSEKYLKKATSSGIRLSPITQAAGTVGLMAAIGTQNLARLSSLEQLPSVAGTVAGIGTVYAALTWPKIANAFMEKDKSKLGEALRRFARNKTNMGAALNTLRNDILSAAKDGEVSLINPSKPKLPDSTLIPPAITEQATEPMKSIDPNMIQ